MKILLSLLIILGLSGISCGQQLITDDSVTLKKGIYKDYYEFRTNCPSLVLDCPVIVARGSKLYFTLAMDREKARSIGEIVGFCDGRDVYLGINQRLNSQARFCKLSSIGRYCQYYREVPVTVVLPGGNGTFYTVPVSGSRNLYFLDFNTGRNVDMRKKNIRAILENDPELYSSYLAGKKSEAARAAFLAEYSQRHAEEIERGKDPLTTGQINEILRYRPTDSSLSVYYERVMAELAGCREISTIALTRSKYPNGNDRIIGLKAVHKYGHNDEFHYKIGVWRYYDRDGSIVREVVYDLTGHDMAAYSEFVNN